MIIAGQKLPDKNTGYGIHPMFRKPETPRPSIPEPSVSLSDPVSTAEATILAFTAERSLSYSDVPDIIALSKTLAKDRQALDRLSMDRTTASYKMTHGLGKTFQDELIDDLQNSYFSLNRDECTRPMFVL